MRSTTDTKVQPLEDILTQSSATPAFKEAVRALAANQPQTLIRFNRQSPPVKALRLVMKLLESYSDYKIDTVEIDGQSGCSEYSGEAVAQPGDVKFDFEWDCRWRAEEQGWTDPFGDPDQIRAARSFGYQCFRRLDKR